MPVDGLIEATARALRRDGPGLAINLHNGGPLGYLPLREFLVRKLARYRGINVTVDEILITSGSQTAVGLLNTALLEAGDTVIAENFSYVETSVCGKWTLWVSLLMKTVCEWTVWRRLLGS